MKAMSMPPKKGGWRVVSTALAETVDTSSDRATATGASSMAHSSPRSVATTSSAVRLREEGVR